MYRKVLVPVDGTTESLEVLSMIQDDIGLDTEIVLLRVLQPAVTQRMGNHIILGSQQDEVYRNEAMGYLKAVAQQHSSTPGKKRCEVAFAWSVSQGIVNYAQRESVDLIAMHTHDYKLLGRHIKQSIAKEVQLNAPMKVQVFGTRDLKGYDPHEAGSNNATGLDPRVLKQIDLLQYLTDEQIRKVAALGRREHIAAGEPMGVRGELGPNLYMILEGEAHLTTHCEVGEISVRIARPGEAFPLASLLGSGTLITSGEALTNMEVFVIPRSEMLKLCASDTKLGMTIYAEVGRLFSNRYAETLVQVAISAERELRVGDS